MNIEYLSLLGVADGQATSVGKCLLEHEVVRKFSAQPAASQVENDGGIQENRFCFTQFHSVLRLCP